MQISREIKIVSDCYSEEIGTILGYFLPQCSPICVEDDDKESAVIQVRKTEFGTANSEQYRMTITEAEKILIEYNTYLGLRNALATFSQQVHLDGDQFSIEEGVIDDAPVAAHRGVMLDLARGIKDFETLCDDVIFIAKCKMNRLHLHLFDDKWVCYEMDSVPVQCRSENAYTKKQMRQLCELATLLGLEVIPEFDMPAHATNLLRWMPRLQCEIDAEEPQVLWAVCAGTEKTYKFYENVIHEIAELFPGKYIHVGGDELEFSDVQEPLLCHWDSCKKCRALCEREHISGKQEIYYYFMNRIYELVKKENRRMIMWSDQIDCMHPVTIPKDVILHFWRVAAPGRGPVEGCSFQRQLELGHEVINSAYRDTYLEVEHHMSSASISDWRWDKRPECAEKYTKQIIGSEICFWEYGNPEYSYYDRVLYPAVAIMADKLWNGRDLEYTPEYSQRLTRMVLGAEVPIQFDLFQYLGDVIPPRNQEYAYYDKVKCSDEELVSAIRILEEDIYRLGDGVRANTYRQCIQAVLKTREGVEE